MFLGAPCLAISHWVQRMTFLLLALPGSPSSTGRKGAPHLAASPQGEMAKLGDPGSMGRRNALYLAIPLQKETARHTAVTHSCNCHLLSHPLGWQWQAGGGIEGYPGFSSKACTLSDYQGHIYRCISPENTFNCYLDADHPTQPQVATDCFLWYNKLWK